MRSLSTSSLGFPRRCFTVRLWAGLLTFVYLATQQVALASSGVDCPMNKLPSGSTDTPVAASAHHDHATTMTDSVEPCPAMPEHDGAPCNHDCASAVPIIIEDWGHGFVAADRYWDRLNLPSRASRSTSPPLPPPLSLPVSA
jgi:hypothetical protein